MCGIANMASLHREVVVVEVRVIVYPLNFSWLKGKRIKKKKIDDDQEEDEMKKHMEIVVDVEEIAVDAIPLATKPPIIIDWKIIKERKMGYFQLIRADGSSRSDIWRNLQGHKVTVWKLFSSSGVHFMRFQNLHIFMLVEKKYPLTPATITAMLNKKLQTDHWNKMCYQLLKLMTKQGRIVRIKRLHDDLGVNTAKEEMDLETAQTTTTAKLPILKQGEYDMWRLRIEQYFQVQDYALWDVIENGNSFKPVAQTTTNAEGTSTTLISGPVTTEEKTQKKNDVKKRSMLLMALPNKHLLTFNQYKDAKTLFASIQTRFGGNDAIKKIQKTLLKHIYENFSALSTESLDSIFNRLQKIISQLAILGENISQEDLNFKEHGLCDLEQIHEDDLEEIDLKWQLALLSMRTRWFFQKTGRKITINESDTAGYDKSKVECFNYHKMGHFARECRGSRSQDNRNRNQDSSRRTVNVEETSSKAMLAIDGADFD
ncbi:ribonuclease H-like domain-containing protein [Tanacetum coccineum]|uniref:Ribonuclease H-like domain-containing protein n=1 Tax=Tanacetum coccineum TaxID=301880 RepID=A0ABQ5DT56_9ASTR